MAWPKRSVGRTTRVNGDVNMDYYVIPPHPNLREYDDHEYHMAIAPLIKGNDELIDFYKDKTTIIDNGEYEDIRCGMDTLFNVSSKIDADYVVLPDKIKDREKTLEMANRAQHRAQSYNFSTMGVAQGETVDEIASTAKTLHNVLEVDLVALPVFASTLEPGYTGRMLIQQLIDFPVHLLGLYSPDELRLTTAKSVDTSYPFKIAQCGKQFGDKCEQKLNFSEATDSRQNFEKFKELIEIWGWS